jgi:hypothetical protein
MMMLLENFTSLLHDGWSEVFAQKRTLRRAIEHAVSLPMVLGRRTISRTICSLDRAHQDWSADYKLFSRSGWQTEGLFTPILRDYLDRYPRGPIGVAFDDTKIGKSGKKIAGASWQRDPMSPPFHVNFLYGLRFIQGSLLFPWYRSEGSLARAVPVRFEHAPCAKKPGKRATHEQQQAYDHMKKEKNLSTQTLQLIEGLRRQLDEQGARERSVLAVVDGSFCNRTLFRPLVERVNLLARCRKDARLCMPASEGGRRKYAVEIFTPEQVRTDDGIAWKRTRIHYAGKRRSIRYKVLHTVLWRRGAATRPLQLMVIAPQPYKLSKHSRTNYREPAYLLTTDRKSSSKLLIQYYVDRWHIEVNHRDEKSLLGVGQAQVRSPLSIPRHPAFAVASYSMLWLAALRTFGTHRTEQFCPLPKWRKKASHYSTLDLLTLLRKEITNETSVSDYIHANMAQNLMQYGYT